MVLSNPYLYEDKRVHDFQKNISSKVNVIEVRTRLLRYLSPAHYHETFPHFKITIENLQEDADKTSPVFLSTST